MPNSYFSDPGIGAELSQNINGEEIPMAYGNRVLTKQARQYFVTQKELPAAVYFRQNHSNVAQ